MPLKLPAPDFGTDEQAGPKSMAAAAGEEEALAEEAGAVAVEDGDELHAAAPRLTAIPAMARKRYWCFISFLL
jgi:hypothetical protein